MPRRSAQGRSLLPPPGYGLIHTLTGILEGAHGQSIVNTGLTFVPRTVEPGVHWSKGLKSLSRTESRERLDHFAFPFDRLVTTSDLEQERIALVDMELGSPFATPTFEVGRCGLVIPADIGARSTPWQRGQRDTGPIRRLFVAAVCDLLGISAHAINPRRGLERERRHPGLLALAKPTKAVASHRHGRRLLAAIGAWPWAHFPAGDLTELWWKSDKVLQPLISWMQHEVELRRRRLERYSSAYSELLRARPQNRDDRSRGDEARPFWADEVEATAPTNPIRPREEQALPEPASVPASEQWGIQGARLAAEQRRNQLAQPAPGRVNLENIGSLTHSELVVLLSRRQTDARALIEAVGQDSDLARRVLDAEKEVTRGKPRPTIREPLVALLIGETRGRRSSGDEPTSFRHKENERSSS